MPNQPSSSGLLGPLRAKRVAGLVVGQSAIGLAGLGLAWGLHGSPWLALGPGFTAAANVGVLATIGLGAVAALPMLAFIALGEVLEFDRRFPSLAAVSAATQKTVLVALGKDFRPLAAGFGALLLALAAGAGEEVLFRGVMQEEITSRVSGPAGLVIASLVFGALHAVTPAYALLASAAGAYFGWLYNACGHSVVVPAVAHALYDWIALLLVHYEVTKGEASPARDKAQLKLLGLSESEDNETAPPKAVSIEA
jgi:membrane protease YdiL (CAAX protease family)